ncbi:MAG: hypothetical protein J6R08_05215 [Opitutales bacterium]|nr:hypothetical protein [Opitutales bacterium]
MSRLIVLIFIFAAAHAFAEEAQADFDAGVFAYANEDFKTAKERLLKVELANDAKSRFADFLLAMIAVKDGDDALARSKFERCFKNLPEGNELNLAKIFAAFCDINGFFKYEVELLAPFYKTHREIVLSDSLLAWRFARSLIECGKPEEAKGVLKALWQKYSSDKNADGVDKILFDERACSLLKDFVAEENGAGAASARAKIVRGEFGGLKLPEDAGVGLVLKFLQLKKEVGESDLNRAVEENSESEFAYEAWYALAVRMFEEGQYEISYAMAVRALSLAPDSLEDTWKIYVLAGDCLRFQKKYKEARGEYLKISMNRKMQGKPAAEAIYKCGLSYFEEEKWANAYECFQRVFVAYFGFEEWSSLAYYYGAKSLLELGDPVGARNILREYLRHSRQKDSAMYHKIAVLWSKIKLN